MEKAILFSSRGIELEGRLAEDSLEKAAVITHPHPLYGGDMHNHVVETVTRAYRKRNYTTLRFNFRGVGGSGGSYSEGAGEREDVRAALSLLRDMGISRIELAGYSFGAWVNAHLDCRQENIHAMVMVSPPVAFMGFEAMGSIPCLKLVVTGSRDEIAPPEMIGKAYPLWNPEAQFEVIPGADHFYGGCTDRLEAIIVAYLESK